MRQLLMYGRIALESDDPSEATPKKLQSFLDEGDGDVLIRVNSYGGEASAGLAMYHLLQAYDRGTVTTVIDGVCCSAATLLAIGAKRTLMNLGTVFNVHQSRGVGIGTTEEMETVSKDLATIDEGVYDIYMTRFTGSREELIDLCKEDRFLSRSEALKYGFATSTDSAPIAVPPATLEKNIEVPDEVEEVKAEHKTTFEKLKEKRNA